MKLLQWSSPKVGRRGKVGTKEDWEEVEEALDILGSGGDKV